MSLARLWRDQGKVQHWYAIFPPTIEELVEN